MATSNTIDVFREAVGRKIVGLYTEHHDIAGQIKVLVFDDGSGLAFGSNGAHWSVDKHEIRQQVIRRREELERLQSDLHDVMVAEGTLAGASRPQVKP